MKYLKFVRENFNDPRFPVFRTSDLRASLGLKGITETYLNRMLNYLSDRGEVKRITKGIYTFHDDIVVVGFAYAPFYYGLENALTIRGLWDQNTNPIVMTWRNVRIGARKFGDGNYTLQRISKREFFGSELVRHYDFWIPVSDYEKTLIDFVRFGHHMGSGVLSELSRSIDKDKLDRYLKAYDADLGKKVRGCLK